MKNIIRLVCLACVISIAAVSCKKEPGFTTEQTDFMDKKDVFGVYSATQDLFVYSESICQLYYSPTRHSARVLRDDLSAYVTVTFSDDISSNSTVKGSVSLQGFTGASYRNYDLRVLKVEDGKAWVWYEKGKTGYIIPWGV